MNRFLEQSPLNKTCAYTSTYNPTLLYPIPRCEQRAALGLKAGQLPFYGGDCWHGYELSWLNPRGKPLVGIARFQLPCDSPYLIESKSLKLYLNGLNQSQFASIDQVTALLTNDLSACAGAPVAVALLTLPQWQQQAWQKLPGVCVDDLDITVKRYDYDPTLLQHDSARPPMAEVIHTHLLKSNCPVTGQPDWGTLVVAYRGDAIDHATFLQYICSFRTHQAFHEHCVEQIFIDLTTHGHFDTLTVSAHYLRRGGLDINPWRSTHPAPPASIRSIRQ